MTRRGNAHRETLIRRLKMPLVILHIQNHHTLQTRWQTPMRTNHPLPSTIHLIQGLSSILHKIKIKSRIQTDGDLQSQDRKWTEEEGGVLINGEVA